jgi:hypothetical protein
MAGLGVLFAHGIDGARVQGQFLATSGYQAIQIEPTRPTFKIAGAGLTVEQSVQGFDAYR